MTTTTPQTVLITGATSGIGRHAALYLAERGFRVFATGRNVDALAALADEAKGGTVETFALDVTDADSVANAAREVERRTDGYGLDVLINNAGYGATGPLELMSDRDLRAQFDVNVFGLMAVTRAFLGQMRARGAGRIINVSSMGGRFSFPMFGAYTSTKFAVEAMSDALRIELAPFGVRVVLIEPGPIATNFSQRSLDEVSKYRDPSSPYARVLARADELKQLSDDRAVGPECISRAIHRAIHSRRPRARYAAPLRAQVAFSVLRALPTRLSDTLLGFALGLRPGRMHAGQAPRPSEPAPELEVPDAAA